jgi:hypothetical protein
MVRGTRDSQKIFLQNLTNTTRAVTIPQGAGSVRFAVTGQQVQSVVSAVITASWKGTTVQAAITVQPPN